LASFGREGYFWGLSKSGIQLLFNFIKIV